MPEPSRTTRNDLIASLIVIRSSTAAATSATGAAATVATAGTDQDPAVSQAAMITFGSTQFS